jgi:ribosome-associated translation inhibitor RaiA
MVKAKMISNIDTDFEIDQGGIELLKEHHSLLCFGEIQAHRTCYSNPQEERIDFEMATFDPIVSTHHFRNYQKDQLAELLEKKLQRIEKMCKRFKDGRVSLEVDASYHPGKGRYEMAWRLSVPKDTLHVHVEDTELGKVVADCQEKMVGELYRYRDRIGVKHHDRKRAVDVLDPTANL